MKFTGWATVIGVILFIVLIGPLFTQLGWYFSMTPIFGLEPISWLEALGLNLLGSCVFGRSGISKKD